MVEVLFIYNLRHKAQFKIIKTHFQYNKDQNVYVITRFCVYLNYISFCQQKYIAGDAPTK